MERQVRLPPRPEIPASGTVRGVLVWSPVARPLSSLIAVALAFGCQGSLQEPSAPWRPGDTERVVCTDDVLQPGRAPLRRLTVDEYDHTLADLFGVTSAPALRLVDNERGVVSADARRMTPLLVEQYMAAAEDVSAELAGGNAPLEALTGCSALAFDDACARSWIEADLPRAYRRPVTPAEVDRLYALYEAGRDLDGFATGIQLVLEAILQSPSFLYRVEIVPVDGEPIVRLTGHQLATRLSYFLVGSMPDPELFAAAEAGALDTESGVEEQARRLLAQPEAEATVQRFFARVLELDHLDETHKDPAVYPEFTPEIAALMRQETEAMVREVIFEGDGSWRTLMTADWSMMNRQLADYYGVSGPTGDAFERVALDGAYHAGLLTQGSVLATRARAYETSPIHRGMFVRGTLLCGDVPDVPEGLEITPPPPDPNRTTRERLAEHRESPDCRSCHEQIDPLGFAFEHFDGAGVFRADENGLAIDATGEVVGSDAAGAFDGAPSMAELLVESEDAQTCFTSRWFVTAYGRAEDREDACIVEHVRARFVEADYDVRELLVGLTLSDAFLYRVADQDTLTETPTMEASP